MSYMQCDSKWKRASKGTWNEEVVILTDQWAADGWTIRSLNVLKSQEAYKVTVEYSNKWPDGKEDGFSGFIWRNPDPNWKPTGVTWFLEDVSKVIINWWPRSRAHHMVSELGHSLKRSLSMDDDTDIAASASAAVTSAPAETGMTGEEMAVPTTSNSDSSSTLDSPLKRMRATEGSVLSENP